MSSSRLMKYCLIAMIFCLLGISPESAAQSSRPPKLEEKRPAQRELEKGQTHSYRIKLREGEFLRIAVEQKSIDVITSLTGPDGKEILEVNNQRDLGETETVMAIAGVKGYYRLDLRPAEKEAKPGSYAARIEALRNATEEDRHRVSAEQLMREGQKLRADKDLDVQRQAIEKYQQSLAIWRKISDRQRESDALNSLGIVYRTLTEYQQSLDFLKQGLALRRELGDRKREAGSIGNLGQTYEAMRQYKEALDHYQQALAIRRETGGGRDLAITLNNIGTVNFINNDPKQALGYFEQAAEAWRAVGDQRQEAGALARVGRAYDALRDKAKAMELFNQALTLYRTSQDQEGEASLLLDLGRLNREAGNNKQALEYLQQALPVFRTAGQKLGEANTLNNLGLVYRTTGDKDQALENYNLALGLSRELKNQMLEATVLNNLAAVYFSFGENQKALDSFREVLPIRRAVKDLNGEASTLTNMGGVHANLGENQQALDYYNQALPIWRDLKRRIEEAIVTQNMAETLDRLGEKQKALDHYDQALALVRPNGPKQVEGGILINLATLYSTLGEKEKARDIYLEGLTIQRATGNTMAEAMALHQLGFLHYEIEDLPKALDYLGQALPLWRKLRDRRGEAITLTATGMVYRALNERDKSIEYSNQALPLHRAVGNRAGEGETLINLGMIYSSSGDKPKAIEHFNQAVELSRAISDPLLETKARYQIANLELQAGDLEESRRQIEETLRIVESLRTKVASQDLRTTYFASVQKYYDFYIDLLMRLHERQSDRGFDGAALQASERARARSLLEILVEANANIREGVDPALLQREQTLQQQLNGKAEALTRLYTRPYTPEQAEGLRKDIDALSSQYQDVRAQIRQASPRYAALTQPAPLSLKEIQQQVLDGDTVLLEYSLGEERSFLWVVTQTGITSHVLPKRAEIEEASRQVYELLSRPNMPYRRPAQERRLKHDKNAARVEEESAAAIESFYSLSDMLLKPAAAQLLGKQRLLIVAEGALQYLPFAALPSPETGREPVSPRPRRKARSAAPPSDRPAGSLPLIFDHEIISLPSAATLALLRREIEGRRPAPKTLAVFADPVFEKDDERVRKIDLASDKPDSKPKETTNPAEERLLKHFKSKSAADSGVLRIARLPFTRQEANQIIRLVPEAERMEALDFYASRATATANDLSNYRFVHFATHGYLDSEQPELSALVLSLVDSQGAQQSGFLYAHEVYNLKLPAEVVVLSACETGLGKEIRGEGLVGLTRGFMYAGTPRVVVSLWSVNDKATAELMTKFYQRMITEGLRPAAALRAAQIEMSKQTPWSAPYYWAAFVLQGEWK